MSFWSALVAIVAIIAYTNMRRHRERGGWDGQTPTVSQNDPALEREVIELRRRVEVIERILTDQRGTQSLADEIEALRDR